jgi:hypothetical protein
MEIKWSLGNVYGAAQADHKEEFLVELAALCSKIADPYIIGGDFNIIRFPLKNRNFCPNRFSSIFNTFINVSELREIYISGDGYTWSNNQELPTLEKLDRILVTKKWEILFPTAHVYKMPRIMSDHNPLILSTQNAQRGKMREFRFELSWLKDPEFLSKVKRLWEEPTRDSSILDKVHFKLGKVRKFLKGWGYNRAGLVKKGRKR